MANKILFIGVGNAGSKVVDKVMKDYPELFNSVAIGVHRYKDDGISCPYLDLLANHKYCENPGFMNNKENVSRVMEENMEDIRNIFKCYTEDIHDEDIVKMGTLL